MPPETPVPSDPSPLKQIRTYQGDVQDALARQKESVFSIREKERARDSLVKNISVAGTETETDARTDKGPIMSAVLLLLSLLLLAGGGAAAWYSYRTYEAKTAVPAAIPAPNRIIPVQSSIKVKLAGLSLASLAGAVQTERTKGLAAGAVEEIQITKGDGNDTSASTTDLLLALGTHAPATLVRAFDPVSMLGLIGAGQNQPASTFLLVRLDSYDRAYAGMLEWEASLPDDLLPLFADASTTDFVIHNASSTPMFKDLTVKNTDTRALFAPDGAQVMIYAYFDQNVLILTDNAQSLQALSALLTSQKLSR